MAKTWAGRGRPERRRGPDPPVLPRPAALHGLYEQLLALPNVRGCFVGYKRRGGRQTRMLSIICCVDEKARPRALAKKHRIPRTLRWSVATHRGGAMRTDVQVLGASTLQGALLGAGDLVRGVTPWNGEPQATVGTIGVAMHHPDYGPVVTTAGHVLADQAIFGTTVFPPGHEPQVALQYDPRGSVIYGRARKLSIRPEADYALISPPEGCLVENIYRHRQSLGVPYAPQAADIGAPAYVLAERGIFPTRLCGIHGALQVGELPFRDLLVTEYCTEGGDSGGCLVNQQSRVMGLVEGVTEVDGQIRSVFSSVAWPFVFERGVFF